MSEKMDSYADKESAPKTKERVGTKTFKRKRKRQNQKQRMSPGTKTLQQILLSLQSFNIYINLNSHLMHCSRFCRIICSRIIIMSYSSPFPPCLPEHRSKHLKEQSRNKKSNIQEIDSIHSVKVFPVPSYPSPKH